MADQHCNHHFEHVKQARPFTEREYMQCVKCGLQNPLGLLQHWDTHRGGPVPTLGLKPGMLWKNNATQPEPPILPRDNGGKLPAGLDYFHNLLSPPGPFMRLLKRKRKRAITVRKLSGWYGNFWKFSCTPCGLSINYPTWGTAYNQATHHAHNHH